MKKIVISAGGTGGHLFPAQILAENLLKTRACEELLFISGGLSKNRYFKRHEFAFLDIPVATFSLKNPLKALVGSGRILKGFFQSIRALSRFKPHLVVGFGSFYTFPVLLAALVLRIPIILHEQNAVPGIVNRFFARFAKVTAITFPSAARYLKGKHTLTAFPMRDHENKRENLYAHFGLNRERLTFFILGGSQGARSINHLFFDALDTLIASLPPFQVIHLTGSNCDAKEGKRRFDAYGIPSYVVAFEPDGHLAWEIADLAVARAGGGSIAEQIASKTPGILIPYPLAKQSHQEKNAAFFVDSLNGGALLLEKEATPKRLSDLLIKLERERLVHEKNLEEYTSGVNTPRLEEVIISIW